MRKITRNIFKWAKDVNRHPSREDPGLVNKDVAQVKIRMRCYQRPERTAKLEKGATPSVGGGAELGL